jgi:hypothetical protein
MTRSTGTPSTGTVALGLAATALVTAAGAAYFAYDGRRGLDCPGGARLGYRTELILGRNIGADLGVTEEAFQDFLDREVTVRLPDGFTVVDTRGQWRDTAADRIVREPGKALVLLTRDAAEQAAKAPEMAEIAAAYRSRFQQQAVLAVVSRACVSFEDGS